MPGNRGYTSLKITQHTDIYIIFYWHAPCKVSDNTKRELRLNNSKRLKVMENAMMVALSRQITLRRELSITANNLANMSTAGFKVEKMLLASNPGKSANHTDGPAKINFVQGWGVSRNFSDGRIEMTNRPMDMALVGPGFFVIETEQGEKYTRDGRFDVDETGTLVSADGNPVLDDTNSPILLDAFGSSPEISKNGTVFVAGAEVARLKVVQFPQLGQLSKDGSGRYSAAPDAEQTVIENPRIMQGFLERSNVVPILEISKMIEVTRAYKSVTNMLKSQEDNSKDAIKRLGRVR